MGSLLSKAKKDASGVQTFDYSSTMKAVDNESGGGLGKAIGSIGNLFTSIWDHSSKKVSPSDSESSRPLLVGASDSVNSSFFSQPGARGGLQFSSNFDTNSVPGVEIR